MAPAFALWSALCAGCCAALLVAEYRASRQGIWVFKTGASTSFVAAAVAAGALDSGYGARILIGLGLCWWGDVLLIPNDRPKLFLAGIGAFFLAHVTFAGAFWSRGVDVAATSVALLAVAVGGGLLFGWLRPHLVGLFRAAVPAYILVVGGMVALAIGAVAAGGPLAIAVGAIMFAVSDVSVASNRFVKARFAFVAWGLPLYFAGQIVIASSMIGQR